MRRSIDCGVPPYNRTDFWVTGVFSLSADGSKGFGRCIGDTYIGEARPMSTLEVLFIELKSIGKAGDHRQSTVILPPTRASIELGSRVIT